MSSVNVDLVRSIFAAWEQGDFSSSEWAHPEIEYVWVDGPSPGSWTGLAGRGRGLRGAAPDPRAVDEPVGCSWRAGWRCAPANRHILARPITSASCSRGRRGRLWACLSERLARKMRGLRVTARLRWSAP